MESLLVAEGMFWRVHVVDALLQGDDVELFIEGDDARCRAKSGAVVLWARWKRDERWKLARNFRQ